jgi:hypothetical protein
VNSRGIGAGDQDDYAEKVFAHAESVLTRAGQAWQQSYLRTYRKTPAATLA